MQANGNAGENWSVIDVVLISIQYTILPHGWFLVYRDPCETRINHWRPQTFFIGGQKHTICLKTTKNSFSQKTNYFGRPGPAGGVEKSKKNGPKINKLPSIDGILCTNPTKLWFLRFSNFTFKLGQFEVQTIFSSA